MKESCLLPLCVLDKGSRVGIGDLKAFLGVVSLIQIFVGVFYLV